MADVTGPISTLSGALHAVPDNQVCDEHSDRPAVARVQGETDSFGCEMHDMCQECFDADRAWKHSPEAAEWRKGTCEWCKSPADDLRDRRDYEEGNCGRVYRVCGACVKRNNEYWAAEAAAYGDGRDDDYDDSDDGYDDFEDDTEPPAEQVCPICVKRTASPCSDTAASNCPLVEDPHSHKGMETP